MPGKYIDRAAVTLIASTGFYIFFLNAWNSIPLALACAFLCCAGIHMLAGRRPARFKCTAAQAKGDVLAIASMDDESARAALSALIRRRYPDEDFTIAPMLKHPSASLSPGDVFALWKKHRGEKRLLIACTCPADARAVMYARELTSPKLALVDSRRLQRIIRLTGPVSGKTPPVPLFSLLRRIPGNIAAHASGPRSALSGAALTLLFLASGNYLYLWAGLFSLFIFGCCLPRLSLRRRLFRA